MMPKVTSSRQVGTFRHTTLRQHPDRPEPRLRQIDPLVLDRFVARAVRVEREEIDVPSRLDVPHVPAERLARSLRPAARLRAQGVDGGLLLDEEVAGDLVRPRGEAELAVVERPEEADLLVRGDLQARGQPELVDPAARILI